MKTRLGFSCPLVAAQTAPQMLTQYQTMRSLADQMGATVFRMPAVWAVNNPGNLRDYDHDRLRRLAQELKNRPGTKLQVECTPRTNPNWKSWQSVEQGASEWARFNWGNAWAQRWPLKTLSMVFQSMVYAIVELADLLDGLGVDPTDVIFPMGHGELRQLRVIPPSPILQPDPESHWYGPRSATPDHHGYEQERLLMETLIDGLKGFRLVGGTFAGDAATVPWQAQVYRDAMEQGGVFGSISFLAFNHYPSRRTTSSVKDCVDGIRTVSNKPLMVCETALSDKTMDEASRMAQNSSYLSDVLAMDELYSVSFYQPIQTVAGSTSVESGGPVKVDGTLDTRFAVAATPVAA